MNDFVQNFKSVDEALRERGFTYYGGQEPCYIAKYSSDVYVVVSRDYEDAQVWYVRRGITDEEFATAMTGGYLEYDTLYAESDVDTLPLAWALGYSGIRKYIEGRVGK